MICHQVGFEATWDGGPEPGSISFHFTDGPTAATGVRASITSHFGDGSAFGVRMQYVTADADYGTAGAVRNAYELLGDERVIVISGDVLTDFDLGHAMAEHERRNAEATIALT